MAAWIALVEKPMEAPWIYADFADLRGLRGYADFADLRGVRGYADLCGLESSKGTNSREFRNPTLESRFIGSVRN